MTDDELKAKLGTDVYDALMAKIQPPAKPTEWKAWVTGAIKSWTSWFGAFLIAWPAIQPQVQPMLISVLGKDGTDRLIQGIGVIVILLRIKTTQSLKAKGA